MSYTSLTKRAVGRTLPKSWLDLVVDDLDDHEARLLLQEGAGLPNGSFEVDDGAGASGWTVTDYAGGSHALETTSPLHGAQALRLTATSGGGYVEVVADTYLPVAAGQRIELGFELSATVAGVRVRGEVLWYDAARSLVSTATPYDSTANPTSAARRRGQAVAPATARYYRVQFVVGESGGTVDGVVTIDGVEAGVYHGLVLIGRGAALTPSGSTYTLVAGTHHQAGEVPRVAVIEYEWREINTGSTGTYTLAGDGMTVLVVTSNAGDTQATGQARVPLDTAGSFTVTVSGNSDMNNVYVIGYEV